MQTRDSQNLDQETLNLFSNFHNKQVYCFTCNRNRHLEYLEVKQSEPKLTLICNTCKAKVFEIEEN